LQEEGISDDAALDRAIKKLEANLKRIRKKEVEVDEPMVVHNSPDAHAFTHRSQEEPSFPLVDVPDADVRALAYDATGTAHAPPFSSTKKGSRRSANKS